MISDQTGNAVVHPRLLINKQADPANAPITSCEYADGANNNAGLAQIPRVASLPAAVTAMQTPLNLGVGVGLDCGSTQPNPPTGVVQEIWVPAASTVDTAFYDVAANFVFGGSSSSLATSPDSTRARVGHAAQTRPQATQDGWGRQAPDHPTGTGASGRRPVSRTGPCGGVREPPRSGLPAVRRAPPPGRLPPHERRPAGREGRPRHVTAHHARSSPSRRRASGSSHPRVRADGQARAAARPTPNSCAERAPWGEDDWRNWRHRTFQAIGGRRRGRMTRRICSPGERVSAEEEIRNARRHAGGRSQEAAGRGEVAA